MKRTGGEVILAVFNTHLVYDPAFLVDVMQHVDEKYGRLRIINTKTRLYTLAIDRLEDGKL